MKDRKRFDYSSRILSMYGIPADSDDVLRKVIDGEIRYEDLPVDDDTEGRKGYFFEDQAKFVASHEGQEILCQVLDNEPCRQDKCPMFLPVGATRPMENRYGQPLCGEFRFVFQKTKQ
ncbi:MAG: hypothetical protein AAB521_00245 [Patescibacteria group bacterium]